MRLEKVVELRDGVKVTVRELTPKILRNLLSQAENVRELSFRELLAERISEVVGLLGDCLELKGENWENLSFSEIETVINAFKEVNKAFFGLMSLSAILTGAREELSTLSEKLKKPASYSQKEDTGNAGTTAGPSS